jgi:hypothetical protein
MRVPFLAGRADTMIIFPAQSNSEMEIKVWKYFLQDLSITVLLNNNNNHVT